MFIEVRDGLAINTEHIVAVTYRRACPAACPSLAYFQGLKGYSYWTLALFI